MGILDQLALRGAGVVAKHQQGKLKGEQERYKRTMEAQEREDELRQRAMEMALRQSAEARAQQLFPAQLRLQGALAEDEEARARGTGTYAPKPQPVQRPRYQVQMGNDGKAYRIDLDANTSEPVQGFTPRPPGGGAGIGGAMQNKAAGLAASAEAAFGEMMDVAPNGAPRFKLQRTTGGQLTDVFTPGGAESNDLSKGILSRVLPGKLGGDNLRQDRQAIQVGSRFVGAWLAAVSGAAFTEQEYQRYVLQMMPSTNDDPILQQQKARTWVALRAALQRMAGQYDESVPPERRKQEALAALQGIVSGGQEEAGGPPGQPPTAPVTGTDADVPDSSQIGEDFRRFRRNRLRQP